MEVDRQAVSSCSVATSLRRRGGLQQARHVLEAEDVGAGLLQLVGQADVVLQVVLGAVGIEDVAGVADRAFAELVRLEHRVHRDAHVLDPVQAIEHAEDVDAGVGRLRARRTCTTLSG